MLSFERRKTGSRPPSLPGYAAGAGSSSRTKVATGEPCKPISARKTSAHGQVCGGIARPVQGTSGEDDGRRRALVRPLLQRKRSSRSWLVSRATDAVPKL